MAPILNATGLVKTYEIGGEAVGALRGVDVAIEPGEFVSVMGPSGCGKSTLLHLLGGLDRPDAGEVRVEGTRIDALSESARARLRRRSIGFMFQFFNLIPNLSVADNIEVPALMAGMSKRDARMRREELLGRLGLEDRSGASPASLSGGQQQRVALARALVNRPLVLLADEPTGNLDSAASAGVLDLLRACNREGQTTVLVTHDPRIAATGGRVLRMKDGRIAGETRLNGRTGPLTDVITRLVAVEA
jgi:putative ABC transport system ATP-binding protein